MKKIKKKKVISSKPVVEPPPHALTLVEGNGIHFVVPGNQPSPSELEAMTKKYQESIRNSPMWDEMIRKFGKEKAEKLLLECRARLA